MNTQHVFQTPHVTPLEPAVEAAPAIVLRVSQREADRIVRALEETSLSLGGSPSGWKVAATYRQLAGTVRSQAAHGPYAL